MPYYNKKEYPKQIWVSQIPEREVSLLRENLAETKQTTFVQMRKEEVGHQLSGSRVPSDLLSALNPKMLPRVKMITAISFYTILYGLAMFL